MSTSPEGYMSHCRVIATAQQPNYGAINVPLLIVAGSDDLTAPLSASETILEKYATRKSEKRVRNLSGVGHWHCVEAPADVEGLVKEFVQNIE
jgi:pimeloyl-ACP methyl ester carboxylesterase